MLLEFDGVSHCSVGLMYSYYCLEAVEGPCFFLNAGFKGSQLVVNRGHQQGGIVVGCRLGKRFIIRGTERLRFDA